MKLQIVKNEDGDAFFIRRGNVYINVFGSLKAAEQRFNEIIRESLSESKPDDGDIIIKEVEI